jgi:hypothetical protein
MCTLYGFSALFAEGLFLDQREKSVAGCFKPSPVDWGDAWPFLDGVLHRWSRENVAIMKTSAQVRTGSMLE